MKAALAALRPVAAGSLGLLYGLVFWLLLVSAILLMAVLLLVLPGLERRRQAAALTIRAMMWLAASPLRVWRAEPLPQGPCVVVANHASYLDGMIMTALLPARFHFVVKDDAGDWPLIGWMLRRLGAVFIRRDEARMSAMQMRDLIRRLRNGESLVVFPEGTFVREEGLLPFRPGAFVIATRSGVPVVPAVISGTRRLLGEGAWLPRYSRVAVDFLPPEPAIADSKQLADTVRAKMLAVHQQRHPATESPIHP